jgi:hypothetical protein
MIDDRTLRCYVAFLDFIQNPSEENRKALAQEILSYNAEQTYDDDE